MPTAKKDLYNGFTLVARKGTYVANDVVDKNGWQDDVEPGEDTAATGERDDAADTTQAQPQQQQARPVKGAPPQGQ